LNFLEKLNIDSVFSLSDNIVQLDKRVIEYLLVDHGGANDIVKLGSLLEQSAQADLGALTTSKRKAKSRDQVVKVSRGIRRNLTDELVKLDSGSDSVLKTAKSVES